MYEYRVKEIESIYDGDTMKVVVDAGFGIFTKQTLRLHGINAPEMKGADKENGKITRDWLREKVYKAMEDGGPGVSIKTYKDKKGKYGRLLADVFINGEEKSLNDQMLTEGLVIPFMTED